MIAEHKIINEKRILGKKIKFDLLIEIINNKYIYLLLCPAVIFVFIFNYLPLPGLVAAFMKFDMIKQFSSPWVGMDNFKKILDSPSLIQAVVNTVKLSSVHLILSTVIAILFTLLLNEFKNGFFKRFVQTSSYLPFFLAWISVIGIVRVLLDEYGPVNDIVKLFQGENFQRDIFLTNKKLFFPLAIFLGLWKVVGWSSILYLATLSSINQEVYEAARIDGASRLQQAIYISIPGLKPTIIILLILSMGTLINDNFELIYGLGMQNPFIDFEVIATVVYKRGIIRGDYSLATAFGLFQGIVMLLLILITNKISKKVTEIGLF